MGQRIFEIEGKFVYNDSDDLQPCHCTYCGDERVYGKNFSFAKTCPDCNGVGWFPKMRGNKQIKSKCKTCNGQKYVMLKDPIIFGTCKTCNGTLKVPPKMTDHISEKDRLLLSKLIDFDNVFGSEKRVQTFNEGYLGLGIVGGITDYGRYMKLSKEDFNIAVVKYFNPYQYCQIIKNSKFPKTVIISKNDSGFSLIPVWE